MVAQVNPYRFGVPVLRFARQEAAPFKQQDSLSGRGQGVRQRPSSGAGSDDDYVVVIVHVSSPAMVRSSWLRRSQDRQRRDPRAGCPAQFGMRNDEQELVRAVACDLLKAKVFDDYHPWRTLSACGTANGSSARSGGNGP